MRIAIKGILWGDRVFPRALTATSHFLVAGSTGSGKTTLINRLLWSICGNPSTNLSRNYRAVIYDPKQEMLPILYGLLKEAGENPQERVRVLHPFDKRAYCWDIAADVESPVAARQAAHILVPEKARDNNPFFDEAVRDLLTAVLLTFIECAPKAGAWTFRDVILGMLYEPYLRFLLEQTQRRNKETLTSNARVFANYLGGQDERTVSNIRASIGAQLGKFEPLAAVWDKAWQEGRRFSVSQWKNSNQIVVLGNDEAARSSLEPVNRILFQRMVEEVLTKPEIVQNEDAYDGNDLSWFILDEVREAGRLDALSRLLTKGRSKGAAVVLGFQDIEGLRDVYGKEITNELTGQCQNLAILKLNNPETAEWATRLFGTAAVLETSEQQSMSAQSGPGYTISQQRQNRGLVESAEFIYLPRTSRKNGLQGFFRDPDRRHEDGIRGALAWERDIEPYLPQKAEDTAFDARERADQFLKPWDEKDWKRLGFTGPMPDWEVSAKDNKSRRNSTLPPDLLNETTGL